MIRENVKENYLKFFKLSYTYKIFQKLHICLNKNFKNSFFVHTLNSNITKKNFLDETLLIKIFNSKLTSKLSENFKKKINNSLILNFIKKQTESISHYFLSINSKFISSLFISFFMSFYVFSKIFAKNSYNISLLTLFLIIIFLIPFLIFDINFLKYCKNSFIFNLMEKFIDHKIDYNLEQKNKKSNLIYLLNSVIIGCVGGFFGAQFSFTMGLAIVIGIIISALIFYNTYFGIFVIVFSTPILPTKIILFICAICAVSFCLKISNENIKINFKETEFLIIVFLFLTLISSVTSFFKLNSIKILGMRIILISSYFILANLIKNKNLLLNVLKTITFSALLVSLYGILQYFLKIENSNSWLDKEMFKNISVRVYSTLSNPNVLGEYLNLVFFIPICMFFIEKNKLMKLFYISSAVLIFFALILTFSRGSWVGLLISFLICVLILDKRILIILTVLFIISTLFIPNFIFERFLSIGNISDTSTLYRVYIWFGTFKMLKNFWLFGIGPSEKNFNFVYSNYQYNGITAPHSHNTFLQIFVESGIVNLIIFIILLLFFFRKIIISSKQSCIKSQHFLINLAIGESVLAFCLNGLFDDAFYNHKVSTMFWIIIAIGLANCSIIENKTLNGGEFE